MTPGTSSPSFTPHTSLNISPSLGLGSFSALLNARRTSDLFLLNKDDSSGSDHQPRETRNARNRWIGLSYVEESCQLCKARMHSRNQTDQR